MRDFFFRLSPLAASVTLSIGLLMIAYVTGALLGDPGIDAITLTMSLALGIDFFVLMRDRSGAPRFGTPLRRSLVLALLMAALAAAVTFFYPGRPSLWANLLAALGAAMPGFLAISRGQSFPVKRNGG